MTLATKKNFWLDQLGIFDNMLDFNSTTFAILFLVSKFSKF